MEMNMGQRKLKKKMGRPPMPKGIRRGEAVIVRLTMAEKRAVIADALRLGLSLGQVLMQPYRKAKP
jgi:hypothetical protein